MPAGTLGDKYQEKLRAIIQKHKKEFEEAFKALKEAAKELNLEDEYESIWDNSTNPIADLREFAREHGLDDKYKEAMSKLSDTVRIELSQAYSEVWDDGRVREMREASEKLKKAYKLILRGDYEGAAKAAGIDVEEIEGLPARDAMSKIAEALNIGDAYSDIIGRRTKKKLKAWAIIGGETRGTRRR